MPAKYAYRVGKQNFFRMKKRYTKTLNHHFGRATVTTIKTPLVYLEVLIVHIAPCYVCVIEEKFKWQEILQMIFFWPM